MTAIAFRSAISVHGWIDADFAKNFNGPGAINFFEGIGTAAHRRDELALNVAALDIQGDAKPFTAHVTLVGGDAADVVHAAEPHRHPIQNIDQASVAVDPKAIQFEGGVYPSHIGFESFFTKDNWNYTRGWLAELSPYYQARVKASHAFGDRWSAQVHLLRGWQNVTAALPAAIGTPIACRAGSVSTSFNTYFDRARKFGDVVMTWKAGNKLSVGASADRGRQVPSSWFGAGGYGRYAFDEHHALAFRAARFRDPNAAISGSAQTLTEMTVTYEIRPAPRWILKFEGRRDHSTAPSFSHSRNQTLAVASGVASF